MRRPLPSLALVICVGASSCTNPDPSKQSTIQAKMIDGPNAQTVADLIAANDKNDTDTVARLLTGAKYVEGEYDQQPKIRTVQASDIPHSIEGVCQISSIMGVKNAVRAHWSCGVKDAWLSREFIFDQKKISEVRNIYPVLGR